ncbi:hypothetical protein MQE23_42875 [Streptomyces sp. HP-A2021]|uniref:hypothetical protein n=1 Tax=Streptomyces sp. HP-A2021 TaxID=2927875 RepID=UPI001FAF9A61|nr:hypothetical protein [Streptomyces sp. HP-A2021]UOB15371.1 hypothetical protein MQE23_42875 [Streptomyces sp. HP-A2021]
MTVRPGTALDAAGRTLFLEAGGTAVVKQDLDPQQMLNVPTVEVTADGARLPTSGVQPSTRLLTLTWRETVGENRLLRFHAPWLRLVPKDGFEDTGGQVVLAEVTLGEAGAVTALSPGPRRAVGVPVERVELRHPRVTAETGTSVGQREGAELRSRADGGLDLTVPTAEGARRIAFSTLGTDGRVGIGTSSPGAALEIDTRTSNASGLRITAPSAEQAKIELANDDVGPGYALSAGDDGKWRLRAVETGTDLLVVDPDGGAAVPGNLEVGALLQVGGGLKFAEDARIEGSMSVAGEVSVSDAVQTQVLSVGSDSSFDASLEIAGGLAVAGGLDVDADVNVTGDTSVAGRLGVALDGSPEAGVHVDGVGFHAGGGGGGYSFADRARGDFVERPSAGERWVWYAFDGKARLWSGLDLVTSGMGSGDALDVRRRMRVRQGDMPPDHSAGIWFHQTAPDSDQAFVGMETDTSVGFWGNTNAGWGLVMDTGSGHVSCRDGLSVAGEAALGSHFGRRDGKATLHLFGSIVRDIEPGILSLQSGGDVVSMNGENDRVGVGTINPSFKLDVRGDMRTTGVIVKPAGSFRIDHPLDPANKYLSHSFVESPEMTNVYCGVVETDEDGRASVELPDWFEALNRDFRYQLTPVGILAQAAVESEIKENRFTVCTDQPGVRVSWQVTGVRHDAFAEAHRIAVEEDKPPAERGCFQNPVEHGRPRSAGLPEHREGVCDE